MRTSLGILLAIAALVGSAFTPQPTEELLAPSVLVGDTPEIKVSYGDPNFMSVMLPTKYDSYMPLPNDRPSANRSEYYRMNYENMQDGKYIVTYPKKNKPFLKGTLWKGKPVGTWVYYYSNGAKMKEVVFADGLWKGMETKWWPNGTKKYEKRVDRTEDVCGYRTDFNEEGAKIKESFFVRDVLLKEVIYDGGKAVEEIAYNQPYHVWRNRKILDDGSWNEAHFKIHIATYQTDASEYDLRVMDILKSRDIGEIERIENANGTVTYLAGPFEDYHIARRWLFTLEAYGKPKAYILGYVEGKLVEQDCY